MVSKVSHISIERALAWAQRFAAREWRLLLPVAFAFIALPPLLFGAVVPDAAWRTLAAGPSADLAAAMRQAPWLMPLSLAATIIWMLGTLVVTALASVPRVSVAEAIGIGFRRLPALAGALILTALLILVLATVAAVAIGLARPSATVLQGMLVGVILGLGLFVSTRLVPLVPLLVEGRMGPVAAIRLSWELTQGAFWRLLAAILLYLVVGGVVVLALGTAISATVLVVAGALGAPQAGSVIAAVLLSAGRSIVSTGFYLLVVALTRQLREPSRGI